MGQYRKSYNDEALNFLQRIDSLTTVSNIHPIYFHKHKDDNFMTLDDIKDEIYDEKGGRDIDPIRADSKSATIRNIVAYRKEVVSLQTTKFEDFAWRLFYLRVYGYVVLFTQILRLPLTLLAGILTWLLFGYVYQPDVGLVVLNVMDMDLMHTLVSIYSTIVSIIFIYFLYTVIFEDKVLHMALYNWQTRVRNGIYSTGYYTIDKVQNAQEDIKPLFPTGDLETLIPAITMENVFTTQPYIRRWVQSPVDNEWTLIDISFPYNIETQTFVHNPDKQVIVLLHGISGSSYMSYIRIACEYWNNLGHTVIAPTQRMLGDSIVLGIEVFMSIRVCDLFNTCMLANLGAGNGVVDDLKQPNLKLATTSPYLDPKQLNQHTIDNIHDYYTKLEHYQQILIKKRYQSFEEVFTTYKYGNPLYTPLDTEVDIIQYRKTKNYTPIFIAAYSMGGIVAANYVATLSEYSGAQSCISFNGAGSFRPPFYLPSLIWNGPIITGCFDRVAPYEHILCDNPYIAERITNPMILETRREMDANPNIWGKTRHLYPQYFHFLDKDMCKYLFFPNDALYIDDGEVLHVHDNNGDVDDDNNNNLLDPNQCISNTLELKYGKMDYSRLYHLLDNLNRKDMMRWQYDISKDVMTFRLHFPRWDDAWARLSGWRLEGREPKWGHGQSRCAPYWDHQSFAELGKLQKLRTKLLVVHPQNDPICSLSTNEITMNLIIEKKLRDAKDRENNQVVEHNGIDNVILYVPRFGGHIGSMRYWDDKFTWLSEISYQYCNVVQHFYDQLAVPTDTQNKYKQE